MKIKTTFKKVTAVLDSCVALSLSEKNLTKTGTSIKYLGGGWWNIFGNPSSHAQKCVELLKA